MPQLVKYFASSPKPIQKPADTCNLKDVETESTCQSSKSMRSCLKEKESSWKPTMKTVLWRPQVHAHRTTTYTSRHTHATEKSQRAWRRNYTSEVHEEHKHNAIFIQVMQIGKGRWKRKRKLKIHWWKCRKRPGKAEHSWNPSTLETWGRRTTVGTISSDKILSQKNQTTPQFHKDKT